MIFLNFKTYPETSDKNALKLCRLINNIESPVKIIPCLQTSDIKQVTSELKLPVWTQHLDSIDTPEAVKQDGATGTLLNHSEHPLKLDTITQTLKLCHQHQLEVMVITDSLETIKSVTKLNPDYLGFEDPNLIGGPVPMVQAHPKLIKEAVSLSTQPLIVGGGIRSKADVKKARELGAQGVLVASEFAKSKDPQSTLQELISGFN
jgi:triosephosphate isomerase (TIM)